MSLGELFIHNSKLALGCGACVIRVGALTWVDHLRLGALLWVDNLRQSCFEHRWVLYWRLNMGSRPAPGSVVGLQTCALNLIRRLNMG